MKHPSATFAYQLLDSLPIEIVVIDQIGVIKYVNKAWNLFSMADSQAIQTGLEMSEKWVGQNYFETGPQNLSPNGDLALIRKGISDILASRQPEFYCEYPCHSPTENRWFLMRVLPFHIEDFSGALITHENITDKVELQNKWQSTNQDKLALINSTDDLIWSINTDFILITANEAFTKNILRSSGLRLKKGESVLDPKVFSSELTTFWKELYARVFQGEIVQQEYYTQPSQDREEAWLELKLIPIRDENKIIGAACFGKTITERKKIERDLKESELKYKSIIENMSIPLALNDENNNITYLNPAFTQTFGYRLEDIPTIEDWWSLAYPDLSYRDWVKTTWVEHLTLAKAQGTAFVPIEVKITCADGSERVVNVGATSHDQSFMGTHVVVFNDITEQHHSKKKLDDLVTQKTALLKEIHHRVKNNLQIINSLMNLEKSKASDDSVRLVLEDMKHRIRSMAILHEILYRSGQLGAINLKNYLTQVAEQAMRFSQTARKVDVKIDFSAIDSEVNLDFATPLGLILNELLLNCLKHAFLPSSEAKINLSTQSLGLSQFQLTVSDNGVGLQKAFNLVSSHSLGLNLVTDLTKQLGGEFKISSEIGTTAVVSLTLPAASTSASPNP